MDFSERLHLRPSLIREVTEAATHVYKRLVGERAERNVAHHFAVKHEHHVAGIGDFADDREVEFPFPEDRLGKGFPAGFQDHQHGFRRAASPAPKPCIRPD